MQNVYDVIVVGGGPAGATAAIYASRSGLNTLLITRESTTLKKSDLIENYYGFVEPIDGADLIQRGLSQAARLGVEQSTAEVTGIMWAQESFEVTTTDATYQATGIVLATGMPRQKASVRGLSSFEGKGVSYCAVCDGFFYRGKSVAVIGNGPYALAEASVLKNLAKEVTLLTNGRSWEGEAVEHSLPLYSQKIKAVTGDEFSVKEIVFADDTTLAIDGIFVAEGTASALDLALKLGLENDGKIILTDENQKTNLPGLFAAGDCTGGLMQIAVAVGDGARAGMAVAQWIQQSRGKKAPKVQWGVN